MEVKLIAYTPDPQRIVATAARQCYSKNGAEELVESLNDEQIAKVLRTVLSSGHTSTLEHATWTFAIEGVSRSLTHQLVRHRMASYEQQSQRYVKMGSTIETITPPSIDDNRETKEIFDNVMESISEAYSKLIGLGVPAEDARYVLPNAAGTKIVVTMNGRELRHFFDLRCCNRAQWEIRDMAWRMLDLVKPTAPLLFADAGPGCVRGKCPEGKMTCGKPYQRVNIQEGE